MLARGSIISMGKFDKHRRIEGRSKIQAGSSLELEREDSLIFQVRTTSGRITTVDLRRYRDGDAKCGIGGNKSLILDLLSSIKAAIDGVKPSRLRTH